MQYPPHYGFGPTIKLAGGVEIPNRSYLQATDPNTSAASSAQHGPYHEQQSYEDGVWVS